MRDVMPNQQLTFMCGCMVPNVKECRVILQQMRKTLGFSSAQMAAFFGISHEVMRRWEGGVRNPSAAARRLIQVLGRICQDERIYGERLLQHPIVKRLYPQANGREFRNSALTMLHKEAIYSGEVEQDGIGVRLSGKD